MYKDRQERKQASFVEQRMSIVTVKRRVEQLEHPDSKDIKLRV